MKNLPERMIRNMPLIGPAPYELSFKIAASRKGPDDREYRLVHIMARGSIQGLQWYTRDALMRLGFRLAPGFNPCEVLKKRRNSRP